MSQSLVATSKFLSLVLRHRPEVVGLTLDAQGWASVDELVERAAARGQRLSRELVREIVETSDKQRFALSEDGARIRANQGHSLAVDLALAPLAPPEVLFHGTATRFLDSIARDGLLPGRRQHVHLSADRETATRVGRRHGQPVVLEVAALEMSRRELPYFRAANGVWLTERVPAAYIHFPPP